MKISLAISHASWVPARVESMARLLAQLRLGGETSGVPLLEMTDRAPNAVWSERMWRWAAEVAQGVDSNEATLFEVGPPDWCLFLQDDVVVAPNFWPALRALLAALPEAIEVVGLETAHPAARALCDEDVRICTTSDGLIGVGYLVRRFALEEFLAWRSTKLKPGALEPGGLTEDTMIGTWCLVTGRRIAHPIPTLIDHDTTIASTYGNDAHENRRPVVRWCDAAQFGHAWQPADLELPAFWRGEFKRVAEEGIPPSFYQRGESVAPEPPRHLGRFYSVSPAIAARWVEGFDADAQRRARQDSGERELRRLSYAQRARADWRSKARVLICTPTRGGAHPEYTAGMMSAARLFEADVTHGFELLDSWQWHEDIVRVRSRFLRAALETDCTHVHFRDADVGAPGKTLFGMLRSGHDFVVTPYPRRDVLPERYAIGALPGAAGGTLDAFGCTPIAWAALGCSLISRKCIETMIDHYAKLDAERVDLEQMQREYERIPRTAFRLVMAELERWRRGEMGLSFVDQVDGVDHETVALFQLLNAPSEATGKPRLWGEDQSFCMRARACGFKVQLYLGPGSPADHAGEHLYRGDLSYFGIQRVNGTAPPPTRPGPTPESFALDAPEDPRSEPVEPA